MESDLEKVFKHVFSIGSQKDINKLNTQNLDSWDSLRHFELINQIEEEFNVSLSYREIIDLDSFEKALAILKEKK